MLKYPTRHSFYDEAKCNEKRREERGDRETGRGKRGKTKSRRSAPGNVVDR